MGGSLRIPFAASAPAKQFVSESSAKDSVSTSSEKKVNQSASTDEKVVSNTAAPAKIELSKPQIRFYEKLMINVLRQGDVPRHIAFIMDGNRRYATAKGQAKTAGHHEGLKALKRCMEWCFHLKIAEVTVFAFALENFNRSQNEVEVLMNLAQKNLREMANEGQFLQVNRIKVRICGELHKCPESVQIAMRELEELTKSHEVMTLNICFAYNAEAEVEGCIKAIREKNLPAEEVNIQRVFENLQVKTSPDLLVRTSNEIRLSNFLTIQSTNAQLMFIQENWPEISIFSMLKIILSYQRNLARQRQVESVLQKVANPA